MAFYARRDVVNPDEIGVYHCVSRCVRRAFLCGRDQLSGRDFSHRRQWIVDRLQHLASVFAIDVCGFSIMENHYHVILRIRPDIAQTWTDEEVALRWWRLFPKRRDAHGNPATPDQGDLGMIMSDAEHFADHRMQLASLSWFMRALNEIIARRSNIEDEVTGRFWEGRFKSQRLLDEAAMLACLAYVDLNPIRAGAAETPEDSTFTSVQDRIRGLLAETRAIAAADAARLEEHATIEQEAPPEAEVKPATEPKERAGWLCDLNLKEGANVPLEDGLSYMSGAVSMTETAAAGLADSQPAYRVTPRASDRGYLPMTLTKYLKLLDWTGRELRHGKRGSIPRDLAPILERLGIQDGNWVETVRHFGRWFKRAAGKGVSMKSEAERSGRRWFQGQVQAKVAFT